LTLKARRAMIERDNADIPLSRQSELISLPRSTLYYESRRDEEAQLKECRLMNAIDSLYTERPNLGRNGMRDALEERFGVTVNGKRVRRLMRKMGLQAVYPRPRRKTSTSDREHEKYPYLLAGKEITKPDDVWCADITYIRLKGGFVYLVAIMDWATRCVLSWELSNTLESGFCIEALKKALSDGRRPEIFNTDQGSQFTSRAFLEVLINEGITISMDGAGRALDNIMVERLWRTVKYEEVYLKDYRTASECRNGLEKYFAYYNHQRRHSSLCRKTPADVYGKDPGFVEMRLLAESNDRLRIRTGAGRSSASVASAPATLRFASASATATQLRLEDLPPYSRRNSVQTMGTG